MIPIEQQIDALKRICPEADSIPLPSGASIIRLPNVNLPSGWNRDKATILFLVPPGFPAAQPDCFWIEPSGLRLANNATPQASNDTNPIPGDIAARNTTWFSWHLQSWNPNKDTLVTYFNVILRRLNPAR